MTQKCPKCGIPCVFCMGKFGGAANVKYPYQNRLEICAEKDPKTFKVLTPKGL